MILVEIQVLLKQEVYDYLRNQGFDFRVPLGRVITQCLNTHQCPLGPDDFNYDIVAAIDYSAPINLGGIVYQVETDVRIVVNADYSDDRVSILDSVVEHIGKWFLDVICIAGKTCKVQLNLVSSHAIAHTRSACVKSMV